MSTNNSDKLVLITGVTSGIGRELAIKYSHNNYKIILLAKDIEKLTNLYDHITLTSGNSPIIYPCNLAGATYADFINLANLIQTKPQKLTGLIHNAATISPCTPLANIEINQWYEVFQVNLNSVFMLTKALIPLLKQDSSTFINFSLDNTLVPNKAFQSAYGLSKQCLAMFAETLKQELTTTNIAVNTIYFNKVDTKLRRSSHPAINSNQLSTIQESIASYILP